MKRVIAAVLVALILIGIASPLALAFIAPPESIGIISAHVFQDLAETGDTSIIFYWAIPYPSDNYTGLPPASLSIFFQLTDPTGTTVMQTTQPYVFAPFGTVGYGYGVSSFYFSAADTIVDGGAYQIQLIESPSYYETPASTSHTLTSTEWEGTTQGDMYNQFIQLCDILLGDYPSVALKSSTGSGIVLSAYGESYFRGAVPGIQTLCPKLFIEQVYSPVAMTQVPYNNSLQELYGLRLEGSEIKRGSDRIGAYFSVTGYFILGIFTFVCCLILCIFTMKKWGDLYSGMIASVILCIAAAVLMGNAVFTIVMIGALISAIAIFFQFFGKRA